MKDDWDKGKLGIGRSGTVKAQGACPSGETHGVEGEPRPGPQLLLPSVTFPCSHSDSPSLLNRTGSGHTAPEPPHSQAPLERFPCEAHTPCLLGKLSLLHTHSPAPWPQLLHSHFPPLIQDISSPEAHRSSWCAPCFKLPHHSSAPPPLTCFLPYPIHFTNLLLSP